MHISLPNASWCSDRNPSIHDIILTSPHPYILARRCASLRIIAHSRASLHPYIFAHPLINTSFHPYIKTSWHHCVLTSPHHGWCNDFMSTSSYPCILTSILIYLGPCIPTWILTSPRPYITTCVQLCPSGLYASFLTCCPFSRMKNRRHYTM